jgi:uncharacterized membrane protein YfcA
LIGGFLGAFFGAALGSRFEEGAYGAIFGLFFGAIFGALLGRNLGFKHRLQAQIALCQVQIEENTRAAGRASSARDQPPSNVNAA